MLIIVGAKKKVVMLEPMTLESVKLVGFFVFLFFFFGQEKQRLVRTWRK